MRAQEQGGDWPKRKFFYGELTGLWKERGLEEQAYTLVKHANFNLSDVNKLTLIERNTYISLLQEELDRQQEELESIKGRKTK